MRSRGRVLRGPLEFHDITCTVSAEKSREQKAILKRVSGCFLPGRLSAVIGPSGSGKTTLMNILSGFRTCGVKGKILVGGEECVPYDFRRSSCYIEQDVAMMADLTAHETLKVASQLKMPREMAKERKDKMVAEIVQLLGLEGCLGTMVCKLSGGEKKRLSIAVELVTNPPIMFFDEPTSNLDSMASRIILSHLRSLADSGRVVICIVHQPSSKLFSMFDDLLVLSNGEAIYHGTISNFVPFFKSHGFNCPDFYNPSDFAIEVACGEHGGDLAVLVADTKKELQNHPRETTCQQGNASINAPVTSDSQGIVEELDGKQDEELTEALLPHKANGSAIVNISDSHIGLKPLKGDSKENNTLMIHMNSNEDTSSLPQLPTMATQMSVLLWRSSICTYRNLYLTQLTLFGNIFVGLLLGGIFYNIGGEASKAPSNAGCLFFFLMFLFFANSMPTVQTYPVEMPVVIRQYRNGWFSLRSYFIAKCIADIPMQIITPTLFLVVSYYLTGQPTEWYRVLMMWAICVAFTIMSQGYGLVFGAAFDVNIAVFLVPLTTIPAMLFSGFFVHLGDVSVYVSALAYLSHSRYMYEGMMQAVYGFNRSTLACSEPYCHFRQPTKLLQEMNLSDVSYWADLGALVAFIFIVKLALYIVLLRKVSMKH